MGVWGSFKGITKVYGGFGKGERGLLDGLGFGDRSLPLAWLLGFRGSGFRLYRVQGFGTRVAIDLQGFGHVAFVKPVLIQVHSALSPCVVGDTNVHRCAAGLNEDFPNLPTHIHCPRAGSGNHTT